DLQCPPVPRLLAFAAVLPPLDEGVAFMSILVSLGTRPEAIKLAPVITELRRRQMAVRVVTTAQHRELLDQVLRIFAIQPDLDLNLMRPRHTLAELSGRVLVAMDQLLASDPPDIVLVQGDTTSAFAAGLAAFYRGITVAHVEAGLRTMRPTNPFPEEMNRRLTSTLTSLHFAPTGRARRALLAEGVPSNRVFVTGNTVIDALSQIRATDAYKTTPLAVPLGTNERLLLVTL